MSSYGRDRLWDAATWAELDEAVAEEVQRVSVVRRVFRSELLTDADGRAPSWVSTAQVADNADHVMSIPEGGAQPFVEISVPFTLTPAQVENESVLHTARTLARLAAKDLARSEDAMVFAGKDKSKWPERARAPKASLGAGLASLKGTANEIIVTKLSPAPDAASDLFDRVTGGISNLMAAGWPQPYGLILGTTLYTAAVSRIVSSSTETPEDRLRSRARHLLSSAAFDVDKGVLVSLAGDPVMLYIAHPPTVVFTGETHHQEGTSYNFRVYERVRWAIRDTKCVAPVNKPAASSTSGKSGTSGTSASP
jgi:uncharacterized linocin/CFP29 family protein